MRRHLSPGRSDYGREPWLTLDAAAKKCRQPSYTAGKLISDSVAIPLSWFDELVTVTGYQDGKFARSAERAVDPTDATGRRG